MLCTTVRISISRLTYFIISHTRADIKQLQKSLNRKWLKIIKPCKSLTQIGWDSGTPYPRPYFGVDSLRYLLFCSGAVCLKSGVCLPTNPGSAQASFASGLKLFCSGGPTTRARLSTAPTSTVLPSWILVRNKMLCPWLQFDDWMDWVKLQHTNTWEIHEFSKLTNRTMNQSGHKSSSLPWLM